MSQPQNQTPDVPKHDDHHDTHTAHDHDHDHDGSCCAPAQQSGCGDEGCTGCGDHHEDPDQHRLELEFIFFVRKHYPQAEMQSDDSETQQQKLGALLQQFDEMKERQAEAALILQKQVEVIQQRFPVECDAQYKDFFTAQYWIDNLVADTKNKFQTANDGMTDPFSPASSPPTEEISSHVYKVHMYNDDFLAKISAFLKYVDEWLRTNDFDLIPPNSMNRYGLTLEYIGLGQVFIDLCQFLFKSIVPCHFPFILALQDDDEEGDCQTGCCGTKSDEPKECCDKGSCDKAACQEAEACDKADCCKKEKAAPLERLIFDDVHTFTVQYRVDANENEKMALETPLSRQNVSSLSLHTDASHLTLNLCLGDDFTDGDLYLNGLRCQEHQQIELTAESSNLTEEQLAETSEKTSLPQLKGYAYIHTGTLRHGAHPITSGFRQNLIIWAVNSKLRRNMGYFGPCFICATQVVGGVEFVDETGHVDEDGNRVATSSDPPVSASSEPQPEAGAQ